MKKYITVKMILAWGPCPDYPEHIIRKLFGNRKRVTVVDVLRSNLPSLDRLWVACHEEVVSAKNLRLFACDCEERKFRRQRRIGCKPNVCIVTAVRMSRRYAMGKATAEELSAAWKAAGKTTRWDHVVGIAWEAAYIAWEAAYNARWDAITTRAAETDWQVKKLLRRIENERE